MLKNTVLITGANRGIGLEFVKQYARDHWTVYACCRHPEKAAELQKLAKQNSHIHIYQLDVTKQEHIDTLAKTLANKPIDHLINNAGTYGQSGERFGHIDKKNMLEVYATNAVAPLKICEALLDNLIDGEHKLIIMISSLMGSISDNTHGGAYSYRASKAALNAISKSIAIDLAHQNIKCLIFNPGWVKTQMGGEDALITPEESVNGMRKIIIDHGAHASAEFFHYDGTKILW